ncbi:MAG: FHA domain-containing protein [Anaerolineaceae bacterium]|nr:FHA domain-containing protein [Anaerolineaceae bacterium]
MDNSVIDFPVIIGQSGPLNGQRWVIEDEVLIGRDPTCDIVIADRQVSRFHTRITFTDDGTLMEDMGSKNGTYLNGDVINANVYLQDGDAIQIALVQSLVYLSSDATVPMEGEGIPSGSATRRIFLDKRSKRVWMGQKEVLPPLSAPQFRLLSTIYDQQGKVISRHDLIQAIWGSGAEDGVSEQAFDALVRRLRERLSENEHEYPYIITVRGHGLRLDNPFS